MEFDPFLGEFFRFLRRSDTIDRAVLDFSVVHFPRFLGKFPANVVGVLGEVVAQFLELGSEIPAPARKSLRRERPARGLQRLPLEPAVQRARAVFLRSLQARRHDCLLDLGRAALGTIHERALRLLVVGGGIQPAFEFVTPVADERVAYHSAPRTTCRWAGSAIGSAISKRRPCCSDGMRARALATSAGSTVPPSAMMRPQGSTISEWPYVSRPFSCLPPCAAAKTKHPFSMARARRRTCRSMRFAGLLRKG